MLGFTWLATVPPTAGLIGKLFGVRYLATLFGLATFTHQIGGFFGAWLGGIALARFGDFSWMWYADIALATGGRVHQPADPRGEAQAGARACLSCINGFMTPLGNGKLPALFTITASGDERRKQLPPSGFSFTSRR